MKNVLQTKVVSLPSNYRQWVGELKQRYLTGRIKAALAVNTELIRFYWLLGKDIKERSYANTYGSGFFKVLSRDLQGLLPDVKGFSVTNLKYAFYFYLTYYELIEKRPQAVDKLFVGKRQQAVDDFLNDLCSIPWGHHTVILNRCKDNPQKAFFFVRKTLENNWSRSVLLNFLDTDLYEREGKAVSNFKELLPVPHTNLAQEIVRSPYNFDFLTVREDYDERGALEDALVRNIVRFLLELGQGFAFVGRQVRLVVGGEEFFPDLLFYNLRLRAYVVIELKTKKFEPSFLGQLSFYVEVVNRQVKAEDDNASIGLLICKTKNDVVAKYALSSTLQPIGVSEYELNSIIKGIVDNI